MSVSINVVVTCTKRKSVAVPDRLKFRRVRKAAIRTKVELWQKRLQSIPCDLVQVRELYSGDHWSIARSMEGVHSFRGAKVRLWVASAGYGLLSPDDRIKPYSATFSSDHPDSIAKKTTGYDRQTIFRDWWQLMAEWSGPMSARSRTIGEIAADSVNSPLLIVASEDYLVAIDNDLREALEWLADSDLLSIFSAGCKSLNGLTQHLVPYDARLQRIVGGALRSLNMRSAHKALTECRRSLPTLPVLRRKFNRVLRDQPALERVEGQPMTDAVVRSFIMRELQRDRGASHTPLLRKLRDEGKACEQKRFANLYREVREHLNGS